VVFSNTPVLAMDCATHCQPKFRTAACMSKANWVVLRVTYIMFSGGGQIDARYVALFKQYSLTVSHGFGRLISCDGYVATQAHGHARSTV